MSLQPATTNWCWRPPPPGGSAPASALIALRPGTDPAGVLPRLEKLAARASGGRPVLIITPFVPRQLGEIADVRVLPIVLGGFLILLAIGAVGHALMTAVWRRSRDIAILARWG